MRRQGVLLIAHRGASALAPENTKSAIQLAMRLGAEMIELDVQLTHDRRLVIFHDERLERTTNGRGVLSRWRYRNLARLDSGSWFAPRFAGERILLLSKALQTIRAPHRANLELKRTSRNTALIRQMVQCLRWTRSARRVLVSSFDPALLVLLRAANPHIARALLCHRNPNEALRKTISLGCVAFHPHKSLVSRLLIDGAHAAGLRVHAWSVDRLDEASRLIRLGVDGLVTNDPAHLRAVCSSRGLAPTIRLML